jgi:hypothetical protein
MTDNLADDQVKLVSYAIVFTKPGAERVMPGGEGSVVVTDSLTEAQFVAMIIARYMQLKKDAHTFQHAEVIASKADLKYLKVYYGVPKRWPREPLNLDRREAEALEGLGARLAP